MSGISANDANNSAKTDATDMLWLSVFFGKMAEVIGRVVALDVKTRSALNY